jgi:hypothetical protein
MASAHLRYRCFVYLIALVPVARSPLAAVRALFS